MAKREKRAPAKTGGRKKAAPTRKRSGPRVQEPRATTKAPIEAKAPMETKPQISWEHGKDAAMAKEHTKTADERATIRATSSGHWTNRQKGRG